jgi:hypothetical protein
MLTPYPIFMLVSTGNPVAIIAGIAISLIGIRGLARLQNGRDSNELHQAESIGALERQGVN